MRAKFNHKWAQMNTDFSVSGRIYGFAEKTGPEAGGQIKKWSG